MKTIDGCRLYGLLLDNGFVHGYDSRSPEELSHDLHMATVALVKTIGERHELHQSAETLGLDKPDPILAPMFQLRGVPTRSSFGYAEVAVARISGICEALDQEDDEKPPARVLGIVEHGRAPYSTQLAVIRFLALIAALLVGLIAVMLVGRR
jgi:hypothetical protein